MELVELLIKLFDAVVFVFSLIVAIQIPTLSAQVCLPSFIFPRFLKNLYAWYINTSGDYLFAERPAFFVGVTWVEVLIQWPVSIANLYAILAGKSWLSSTCLIYGVSAFSASVPVLADMIISSRLTTKLKILYFPFTEFALLSILRGLVPIIFGLPDYGKWNIYLS